MTDVLTVFVLGTLAVITITTFGLFWWLVIRVLINVVTGRQWDA